MGVIGHGIYVAVQQPGRLPGGTRLCLLLGVALLLLLTIGCGRHGGLDSVPDSTAPTAIAGEPGAELALDSPAPAGVDLQLWRTLTAALRQALAGRGKTASGIPAGDNAQVLDFVVLADTEGAAQASWSFELTGDYNHNGSVGVDDLTQVAVYWNMSDSDEGWQQARVADGNSDERVDHRDVTVLGVYFGQAVSGFELQQAAGAVEEGLWTLLTQVSYSAGTPHELDNAVQFRWAVPGAQTGNHYRVQAYYAPAVGAVQYGPPGAAMRYYGGTAGAGAWPMGGHDAQRTFRGDAPGPTSPGIVWLQQLDAGGLSGDYAEPTLGRDGAIYACSSQYMRAIQPDGAARWGTYLHSNDSSSPALGADGVLYFTSRLTTTGRLWALNPDGSVLWVSPTDSRPSAVLLANGLLYLHTASGLACFSLAGEQLWDLPVHDPDNVTNFPATQTSDGLIVFAKDDVLYAANPDGALEWQQTLPGQVAERLTAFSDGGVAVPLDTGVCAYSPQGELQWAVQGFHCLSNLACTPDDGLRVCGSQEAQDGTAYVLRGLARDGAPLFEMPLLVSIASAEVMVDPDSYTFICSRDNPFMWESSRFYCVDSTGGLVWERHYSNIYYDIVHAALGADGGLYVAGVNSAFCLRSDGYDRPAPPTPSVSSGAYYDHVRIQWPATAHTNRYRVYREGVAKPLVDTTDTVFDDYTVPHGGLINYTVSGLNELGEGEQSAPVQGRICIPPSRAQAPGDWAMQGHDPQHTYRSHVTGPSAVELKWSYSPATWADMPYYNTPVFAADGTAYYSQYNGVLAALDVDGTELWRIKLGTSASIPAIGSDGTVYVAAEQTTGTEPTITLDFARVYAINPNRTVKWVFESANTTAGAARGSGVTVDGAGNVHCMLSTEQLVTLSPDGVLLRECLVPQGGRSSCAPLLGPGGHEYLFMFDGLSSSCIYAYDSAGNMLWELSSNMSAVKGVPLLKPDGRLYAPGKPVTILNPGGQRTLLTFDTGYANMAAAVDGRVFLANAGQSSVGWLDSDDAYHQLAAVNPWRTCSILLDAAGKVYFISNSADTAQAFVLYCFTADGTALWSQPLAQPGNLPSMALRDDGALFVTTAEQLLVFAEP